MLKCYKLTLIIKCIIVKNTDAPNNFVYSLINLRYFRSTKIKNFLAVHHGNECKSAIKHSASATAFTRLYKINMRWRCVIPIFIRTAAVLRDVCFEGVRWVLME